MNSGIATSINVDAVRFLQDIRNQYPHFKNMIKIGGMIGCKGDAYQPQEGLSCREAEAFHSWQINELVKAEPDFNLGIIGGETNTTARGRNLCISWHFLRWTSRLRLQMRHEKLPRLALGQSNSG